MRVQDDRKSGLARQITGWRDPARTKTMLDSLVFPLVTGSQGLSMRVQEDPNFGLARQIIGWRGHLRTNESHWFPTYYARKRTITHLKAIRYPGSAWGGRIFHV